MRLKRNYIVLATALLVTAPLLYLALTPINLINIQVRPLQNNAVRILSADTVIRSNTMSTVFFDFRALIEDPAITKVKLSIRPSAVSAWFQQVDYDVSNGFVLGTAQLGSIDYPVKRTERYSYRLEAADGTLLSDGQIDVVVDRIAGGETWLIAGIGIFSALLQILSMFLESPSK